MTLIFGNSVSTFSSQSTGSAGGPGAFTSKVSRQVLYFVYLFVGRFVLGYACTLATCIAAARTTKAIRRRFLDATLRQEVYYFDRDGTGSAATQLTTSTPSSRPPRIPH